MAANSYNIAEGQSSATVTVATGLSLSDFSLNPTINSRTTSTNGGTLELRDYNSSNGQITVGWTSGVTPSHHTFNYAKGSVVQNSSGAGDPHVKPLDDDDYTL